jgi:hypothetical protein
MRQYSLTKQALRRIKILNPFVEPETLGFARVATLWTVHERSPVKADYNIRKFISRSGPLKQANRTNFFARTPGI